MNINEAGEMNINELLMTCTAVGMKIYENKQRGFPSGRVHRRRAFLNGRKAHILYNLHVST